ncbi:hypothetical protein [Ekhidna sp. To15]|uniref:hypothetical protein n=1 Tax=Ekhidna sp. To15 TaxID=3395267 RepID=UPI003F52018C
MKSLLLLMALAVSTLAGSAEASMRANQGLSMQLDAELVFEKMVKVYNYEGALVREIPLTKVANNDISVVDNMILEESDFAFDYQGDYYYFADSEYIEAFIN